MSCYHRHGCDGPVVLPDWYDAYGYRPYRYRPEFVVRPEDDYEDERPRGRRGRGRRRRRDADASTDEVSVASLLERATALREELASIEDDLATIAEGVGPRPGE